MDTNETSEIVPVEADDTPSLSDTYKELNKNQMRYLAERPNFKSGAAAIKSLGMSQSALTVWRKQRAFKLAEDALLEQLTTGILNAENRDEFLFKFLAPKAEARLNEILSIQVSPTLPAATMGQVRQAAEKVLEATGTLKDRGSANGNVAVVVQNFIKGSDSERPAWLGN